MDKPENGPFKFTDREISYYSDWGSVENIYVFSAQQSVVITHLEERIRKLEQLLKPMEKIDG